MKKYWHVLSQCPLFEGIGYHNLETMMSCLNGKISTVTKGNLVFLEGDEAQLVGVVLSGAIQVIKDDYYGNRSVLSILQPGESFGEVFACAGLNTMPVSVIAYKDSDILLLDCHHVLNMCSHSCQFHNLLIQNLLKGIAQKNIAFTKKIRYMSKKTTKEKLMSYLLDQAKLHDNLEFVIPYDRQALADYLGVERTAMSAEISKLKKADVLDTKGSWFCLKQKH